MLRKFLVVAAAIAIPVSAIAITGGAVSGAHAIANGSGPIKCSITSTVTFAPPGLSIAGAVSAASTSTTTASGLVVSGTGCSGSSAKISIKSASTKCTGNGTPSPYTACKIPDYGYDSWHSYIATGTSSIKTALAHFNFTLNGNAFKTTTTAAAALSCTSSEVGFKITGKVTAPASYLNKISTISACLGKVTGTGVPSLTNFALDINKAGTLKTATINKANSTIAIS